jgi:hypothetical protein
MHRYSGFSLTIDSELELPDLSPGNGDPDVIVRLGSVSCRERPATIEDEVVPVAALGRFRIKGGREIVVDPLAGADPSLVRAFVAGKLMAYLMRQRGCLPLHASGVAIGGKGVLFLGERGAGKSTAAAAFYARGHRVVADDVGAVRAAGNGVELQASWSGLRLLDDARHVVDPHAAPSGFHDDKHVFKLEGAATASRFPVKRIYFLNYEAPDSRLHARTHVLHGLSSVALLNSNSFLRHWNAGSELRQINLNRSAAIASLVKVHRLVRPRRMDYLPELVDFVETDVAGND